MERTYTYRRAWPQGVWRAQAQLRSRKAHSVVVLFDDGEQIVNFVKNYSGQAKRCPWVRQDGSRSGRLRRARIGGFLDYPRPTAPSWPLSEMWYRWVLESRMHFEPWALMIRPCLYSISATCSACLRFALLYFSSGLVNRYSCTCVVMSFPVTAHRYFLNLRLFEEVFITLTCSCKPFHILSALYCVGSVETCGEVSTVTSSAERAVVFSAGVAELVTLLSMYVGVALDGLLCSAVYCNCSGGSGVSALLETATCKGLNGGESGSGSSSVVKSHTDSGGFHCDAEVLAPAPALVGVPQAILIGRPPRGGGGFRPICGLPFMVPSGSLSILKSSCPSENS
eukprot:m.227266 g.227266  ORF g.227266 m.227266 type:complete len:339 (-) comp19230_c0_seq3:145-1161(-)